MICQPCKVAASFPAYKMFSVDCQFCAARMIQGLKSYNLDKNVYRARRDAILADAARYGITQEAIFEQLRSGVLIGPVESLVSVLPSKAKSRSAGKK